MTDVRSIAGSKLVGISLPVSEEVPVPALVDVARQAEQRGYDWCILGEIAGPEAFGLLGAIAVSTGRIGLGTGVVSIYGRSPALLAMGFATLDDLAPGRILAGLGAGSRMIAEDWNGRPFDRPAARMVEVVESVRAILLQGRVHDLGQLAPVRHFRLMPAGQHHVPIMVAAIRSGMLRAAGAVADVVNLALCPDNRIAERVAIVREGAVGAGRDPMKVGIALTMNAYAGPDPDGAMHRMQELVLQYASLATHQHAFAADQEAVSEALQLFRAGDRAGAVAAVSREAVELVGTVGEPAHVAARVRRCWDAGVDLVALNLIGTRRGDVENTTRPR